MEIRPILCIVYYFFRKVYFQEIIFYTNAIECISMETGGERKVRREYYEILPKETSIILIYDLRHILHFCWRVI